MHTIIHGFFDLSTPFCKFFDFLIFFLKAIDKIVAVCYNPVLMSKGVHSHEGVNPLV